jgi:hypothetical protein
LNEKAGSVFDGNQQHIRHAGDAEPHAFTEPAQIVDGRLSYALRPPRQHSLDL